MNNYPHFEELTFSEDRSRAAAPVPFGFACYERTAVVRYVDLPVEESLHSYTNCGTVGTPDAAKQWLRGEMPDKLVPLPSHD